MITMETGIYKTEYTDRKTGEKKVSPHYTISYYDASGKQVRESTRSTSITFARRLRAKRLAERQAGKLAGPQLEKVTFKDLADGLVNHYEINDLRSIDRIRHSLKHLRRYFGDMRAVQITTDRINRYIVQRKADEASNGTINRELTALKTMLRLGQRVGKVAVVPHIDKLEEAPPREGFIEPPHLATLKEELEEEHKRWVEVLFVTGWRKQEVLSREWSDIRGDENGQRWLCLDSSKSKNKNARRFPVIGQLADALDEQRVYVSGVERRTGQIIPRMFCYPDGRPIRFPEQAFKAAAKRAGLPGLLIHDLRRSGVRQLALNGVSETEIMKLCGMKTRSIFTRYDIVDESRLVQAVEKLNGRAEPERQVQPLQANCKQSSGGDV